MKIVSASISRKETGKFEIEHEYTLDASEEFKEYTKGWTDEEEIMSAFGDYDFIDINDDDFIDQMHKALREFPEVEYYIEDLNVSVGSPIGYPTDTTTMEQVLDAVKKIKIIVEARVAYELVDFDKVESTFVKVMLSNNPDKLKKVED